MYVFTYMYIWYYITYMVFQPAFYHLSILTCHKNVPSPFNCFPDTGCLDCL